MKNLTYTNCVHLKNCVSIQKMCKKTYKMRHHWKRCWKFCGRVRNSNHENNHILNENYFIFSSFYKVEMYNFWPNIRLHCHIDREKKINSFWKQNGVGNMFSYTKQNFSVKSAIDLEELNSDSSSMVSWYSRIPWTGNLKSNVIKGERFQNIWEIKRIDIIFLT